MAQTGTGKKKKELEILSYSQRKRFWPLKC
jgi:hypothetical protein